ncbi:hypothetical protein SDJN03_19230, partial [Cucurbita argyrosperma subsp. sororia]
MATTLTRPPSSPSLPPPTPTRLLSIQICMESAGKRPRFRCFRGRLLFSRVADYVVAKSDPLITTYKKHSRRCQFWKWLCCRGFAVAAMLDARSISKTHPAVAVIIHVNAYHAAAVTYQSGSVALVQHYPDAHALAQSFHAANVTIFHYLHALNAHAVNANAAVAVLETAAVIHATCVASQRPTPLLSPLVLAFFFSWQTRLTKFLGEPPSSNNKNVK